MAFDFPPANLMIIGDSLAQGCRSLSVTKESCAQSWAARVAQQQSWRFVTPDFPIPVLFDLENEVRRLDTATIGFDGLRFRGERKLVAAVAAAIDAAETDVVTLRTPHRGVPTAPRLVAGRRAASSNRV